MKILFASLLKRPVNKKALSSRPRIIYDLISGLLKKNHNITLIGTANSKIHNVKTISVIKKSFNELSSFENPFYAEVSFLVKMAKKIEEIGNKFDIIHNHTYPEFINTIVAKNLKIPFITTIHAQATPELDEVLSLFNDTYYISISKAHKKQFKKTKIFKVIYNGINQNIFSFQESNDNYLLWIGRLSKAKNSDGTFMDPKGIKWAIQLTRKTNYKLKLSGNVENIEFYNRDVKPYLSDKIQWIGPVSSELTLTKLEVAKLMQNAKVFLMTINWEEPFGLVMVEAMACGTPVVAFNKRAVLEIVEYGKTGFIVNNEEEMYQAINKINLRIISKSIKQ